jgi:predicted ATPase/DNA-binding winged helix-turn-helix (wHTH) protein
VLGAYAFHYDDWVRRLSARLERDTAMPSDRPLSRIPPPIRTSLPPLLRVGRCTVEARLGVLARDGKAVALGRRAFKVLVVLLEADGELVSNEDILLRVWDGTVVEHNTVQAQISALRRALGNDRALLKTYSGRGYRLMTASQSSLATSTDIRASATDTRDRPIVSNLPSPNSELIGRQAALDDLIELLTEHRLVTVAGPGGIGKTRLVIEAATRSIATFPGGVFFVDLAALSDASLVAATIIAGTHIEAGFEASLEERARALGKEPVLIVLDNCEHLVVAATRAAETMLSANTSVHVVATSREPLRASGEVIYRVASLEVPNPSSNTGETLRARGASRLFLERAGVDNRQRADPALPDAIAKICRDLDGIPLAIELAAARASSLGIQEVFSRLHECLDLLRGGNRTALPRQRTLRATLEWSHDLLSDSERIVFRRLAVFVGGFQMEAACRVACDGRLSEIEVVGQIGDLVEKSMVSSDLEPANRRYRLLETTRAFALERLIAADELDDVARRHTVYRIETLTRVDTQSQTPRHTPALAGFRMDIDNLRAALDWANSDHGDEALGFVLASYVAPVMLDLQLIDECRTRAARALARKPSASRVTPEQELRLRTVVATAQVYINGPGRQAMQSWTETLAAAKAAKDQPFEIRALWGLWTVCTFAGLPREGLSWATLFDEMARLAGLDDAVALSQRILGISHHYLGNQVTARTFLESMIARYVHGAHPIKIGGVMNHGTVARATLARVLWFQGSTDQCLILMRDAVERAVQEDHALTISYVMAESALPISLLVGDRTAAREYLALLSSSSRRQGLIVLQVVGRCYEAILDGDGALSPEALAGLSAALARLSDLDFDLYSADLWCRLAQALLATGRTDEALAICERNLERTRQSGERLWQPELMRTIAFAHLASDRQDALEAAERSLREAMAAARESTCLALELRTATTLAQVLAKRRREAEGVRLLDEVYVRFTEGFDTVDLIDARSLLDTLRVSLHSSSPAPTSRQMT